MASLTQALSIALSGLQASTALISVTSNNVSNANTPGYTKKTAALETIDYGTDFGGVSIAGYTRATNQALTTDYNNATSAASYASTQNSYMSLIQTALGSTSSDPALQSAVANFSAAWSNYAAQPESNTQQQNVINTAQVLAQDVTTATAQVGALKIQAISDINNNVTSLNSDLKQIASLNGSIQTASAAGLPIVDLQDQVDNLVNKVSSFMNVQVQTRANGQIALYTPSGQLLVDSQIPKSFSFNGSVITDSSGTDVTNALSGGSLQAGTDFISTTSSAVNSTTPGVGTVAKFQSQLSALVGAFTSTTNTNGFAATYAAAVTASTAIGATQAGKTLATSFFTVTNDTSGNPDPSTFAVTTNVANGTSPLPQTAVQAIASSFNATATYTASGLTATNVTYAGLTSSILSGFQQAANIISSDNATAASQQNYYQQSLTNKVGVNTDTELANLVTYQNSYAASAHILTTVNQMLTTLMSSIG